MNYGGVLHIPDTRGTCQECLKSYQLNNNGNIRGHGKFCHGSHNKPLEAINHKEEKKPLTWDEIAVESDCL